MSTGVMARPRGPGFMVRTFGKLRRLALMAVLLCIWQYVSMRVLDSTSRTLLPPPTLIFTAAWELIRSGELFRHARDSLKREMVAFLWASISIPIGIAMGWSRIVDECQKEVCQLIDDNRERIIRASDVLFEEEVLSGDRFREIWNAPLDEKSVETNAEGNA